MQLLQSQIAVSAAASALPSWEGFAGPSVASPTSSEDEAPAEPVLLRFPPVEAQEKSLPAVEPHWLVCMFNLQHTWCPQGSHA